MKDLDTRGRLRRELGLSLKTLPIAGALLLAATAASVIAIGGAVPLFVMQVLCLGAILLATSRFIDSSQRRAVCHAVVAGYLVRLAVILILHAARWDFPRADADLYDALASFWASQHPLASLTDLMADVGSMHIGYPLFVSFVYRMFGSSPFAGELLNAPMGAAVVPLVFWLAIEMYHDGSIAARSAWLYALLPYDIAWGGFLMKDTLLQMLFVLSIASIARLSNTRKLRYLMIAGAAGPPMFFIRFWSLVPIAIACIAAALCAGAWKLSGRSARPPGLLFAGLIAAAIVTMVASYGWATEHIGIVQDAQTIVESIDPEEVPNEFDVITPIKFSPSPHFVYQVIRGTLNYLLQPAAWEPAAVPLWYIFYPGMWLMYLLLPFFLIGGGAAAWSLDKVRIFALGLVVSHGAIAVWIYQSGERERMLIDPIWVVFAISGYRLRTRHTRFILSTYLTLILIAAVQMAFIHVSPQLRSR